MNITEVAKYLRLSTVTVRRYALKGVLKSKMIMNKHHEERYFEKQDIENFLNGRG